MPPSSRTPEGEPNRCLICGYDIRIEPSVTARDAPCPNCGVLLWFPGPGAAPVLRSARALPKAIREMRVADLELTVRATNLLEVEGITMVGDICDRTADELLV